MVFGSATDLAARLDMYRCRQCLPGVFGWVTVPGVKNPAASAVMQNLAASMRKEVI